MVHFADLRIDDDRDASCAVTVLWIVDNIVVSKLINTMYNKIYVTSVQRLVACAMAVFRVLERRYVRNPG